MFFSRFCKSWRGKLRGRGTQTEGMTSVVFVEDASNVLGVLLKSRKRENEIPPFYERIEGRREIEIRTQLSNASLLCQIDMFIAQSTTINYREFFFSMSLYLKKMKKIK